jgi:hypothetical protein
MWKFYKICAYWTLACIATFAILLSVVEIAGAEAVNQMPWALQFLVVMIALPGAFAALALWPAMMWSNFTSNQTSTRKALFCIVMICTGPLGAAAYCLFNAPERAQVAVA